MPPASANQERGEPNVKRIFTVAAAVVTVGVMAQVVGQLVAAQQQDPQAPQSQIQPVNASIPQPAPPPRTRIAIINISEVIKNYDRWKTFEDSYKQAYKFYNDTFETKKARGLWIKEELKKLAPDDPKVEALKTEMRNLDREVQDLGEKAKKDLSKMEADIAVGVYREVNEAVEHYARANDIEMVMHYNDAVTPQDILSPANVQRKLQNPACMPMYVTPGMNITASITQMLNERLRRSMQPQAAAPQR
jgi:Skp family chaperone for outer membrane proteins